MSSLEQNGINVGDHVELEVLGKRVSARIAAGPRYKLADLLAGVPDGLPHLEGWEEMRCVGLERNRIVVQQAGGRKCLSWQAAWTVRTQAGPVGIDGVWFGRDKAGAGFDERKVVVESRFS